MMQRLLRLILTECRNNNEFLRVSDIKAGYGKKLILDGVSLSVPKGQVVALIGHNGAGKSTLLKVIFGILPVWKGEIRLDGKNLDGTSPSEHVQNGISYVPQGNRVFTELTIKENLEIGAYTLRSKNIFRERLESIFTLFPKLKDRFKQNAGTLSGGEQQVLALGMALMLQPRLLLIDEPSLGLSPKLVGIAFNRIQQINQQFGTTVLIVEQKVRKVLKISDKVYVLKVGKVSFEGKPSELLEGDRIKRVFL